jgi:hypothetical protein
MRKMKTIYDSIRKKAKNIFPLVVVAVLSLSLGCTVVAAEDVNCAMCHNEEANNFETSLHYTGAGMKGEYERGAAGEFGIDMDEYYEQWNCSSCHASTCDKCHVGYGFPPHVTVNLSTNMTPCDKCHFKKQTSIFVGDTQAHNQIPIEGDEVPHPADVHYEKGLTCIDCHTVEELHGTGVEYSTMLEAVNVSCEDCHNSPGKTVKNMPVTQYSSDIPSHEVHGDRLDCTACHTGWAPTCVNCHLETRTGTKVTIDDFHLAIGADGKIEPFIKMVAEYATNTTIDNETVDMIHTGYGAWMTHTVTKEAKNCTACHRSSEALCEGCEGQILGEGGSFIPQEIIDWILAIPQGIIDRISGP